MSANSAPTSKKYFSLQLVLLCALPLIALILWIVALSSLATAGGTATASAPARMSVQIPAAAKSAAVVMLEMSIAVTRKAPAAQLGAVVRVRLQAVLRWRSAAFRLAKTAAISSMWRGRLGRVRGGTAEVKVSVIDRGGGPPPSGAALSIGRAQIVTR